MVKKKYQKYTKKEKLRTKEELRCCKQWCMHVYRWISDFDWTVTLIQKVLYMYEAVNTNRLLRYYSPMVCDLQQFTQTKSREKLWIEV